MPNFANPLTGNVNRKMTKQELFRVLETVALRIKCKDAIIIFE